LQAPHIFCGWQRATFSRRSLAYRRSRLPGWRGGQADASGDMAAGVRGGGEERVNEQA